MFDAPKDWKIHGELPPVNIDPKTCTRQELLWFMEDQLMIEAQQYCIDVSWCPALSRDGMYYCSLVKDQEWDDPEDKVAFNSRQEVVDWINKNIQEIKERLVIRL